jgi:hypothetical protein
VAVTLRHESMTIHACACPLRRIRCVEWDEGDPPNLGSSRHQMDGRSAVCAATILCLGGLRGSTQGECRLTPEMLKPDTVMWHRASQVSCWTPGMQRNCGVQLGR